MGIWQVGWEFGQVRVCLAVMARASEQDFHLEMGMERACLAVMGLG
jgi:hypothetical protein